MIVIISSQSDASTNDVIFWLKTQNKRYIRLNESDIIQEINLIDGSIYLKTVTQKEVNLSDVTGYWYRRGMLRLAVNSPEASEILYSNSIINGVKNFKIGEVNKLLDYIYIYLDRIPKSLTSYFQIDPNKLYVLEQAKLLGLLIPNTIISTNKIELKEFLKKHGNCITKPINEIFFVNEGKTSYRSLTVPISSEDIEEIKSDITFPILIQKEVEKRFEIRIFYLLGICYSMAIFSQNDITTLTDFRNYNKDKPNRSVPFQLPLQISYKIILLMNKLKYKTGSIDFIVDNEGNYYFLEINPVGQFGMVSIPCNYNLERKIAEYLYQ